MLIGRGNCSVVVRVNYSEKSQLFDADRKMLEVNSGEWGRQDGGKRCQGRWQVTANMRSRMIAICKANADHPPKSRDRDDA